MILFIQIRYMLIILASLAASAFFAYLLIRDDQRLEQFRSTLRPGDLCRVRRIDGTIVRARIVVKNSDFHFVAVDIDTKVRHLTAASCIYKP